MISYPAEITAIGSDGAAEFILRGGPRNGEKWAEKAQPSYPAGANLPPVVGDLVWIHFREGDETGRIPLAEPYHHGTLSPGTEIVIDSSRNVVLREGTLGVARLTDDVDQSSGLVTWNAQLAAVLSEIQTQITTLGGTIALPVPTMATHIGDISSASVTVLAGD